MSLEEFDLLEIPVLGCLQVAHVRHRRSNQGGRYVRSIYQFGDNHCPSGYRWFARRRIGLGRRDVDHSEASGPAPNLTADQIESRAVNGQDPLRQFSDTCRTELESLQRQM